MPLNYPIYAMRDVKAGFGNPELSLNDATMKRTFAMRINQIGTEIAFSPADYSLYKIGEYEIETGKLIPMMPELVCEGVDCVGVK